jgi:hypothetical protein
MINLSKCMGESPLSGFPEQYRSVTQSIAVLGGQCGASESGSLAAGGDADAKLITGSVLEELEFLQTAELPTVFTYNSQPIDAVA